MSNYYIWTIGCQMNKAESSRLAGAFENLGHRPVEKPDDADIIVLNSCVVRQSAENRAVNKIKALKAFKKTKPGLILAVTGCLVDSQIEKMKAEFPHVDHFFKAGEQPDWLGEIDLAQTEHREIAPTAYIPIIQGCNNFCAYCIVPFRRGREKSRKMAGIVKEVEELVCRGVKEVTLLGQNVDSYGNDLPDKPDLADLLAVLNRIDGLKRIRFLTNHPKDMSLKLIEAIASLDKVCESINLPVQAGSDSILKAMRRGYTAEHYRRLVADIRSRVPDISLTTDVIVGFPSETEEEFQQTFDLLTDLRFDNVHVAAYSPRTGTLAARELEDNIPADVKKNRLERVEKLQAEIAAEINAGLLGSVVEVLVEGKEKNKWSGRTRTDKLVFFTDKADCCGKLVNVKISSTSPWSFQGKMIIDS